MTLNFHVKIFFLKHHGLKLYGDWGIRYIATRILLVEVRCKLHIPAISLGKRATVTFE
jgi:hypothetical protein